MKKVLSYVFLVAAATAINVASNASPIPITKQIPGWPTYLAMGTVTNDAPSVAVALAKTPVDAIFKYAGNNGAGDRGVITGTTIIAETIAQARTIETTSTTHQPTMPVLVVYTIDASGGLSHALPDVQNDQDLTDHFINLIQYCQYMESQKDSTHPHPATIILNPDLFGTMQQYVENSPRSPSPLTPSTSVQVTNDLAAALTQLKLPAAPNFTDTMQGYIQSINWIVRTFSPDVVFGWQENVWAEGTGNWLHTQQNEVATIAQEVTAYINSLGAYQGAYKPDFLVVDRYERDDFYVQKTDWFYNRSDWETYLTYVNDISTPFGVPAMIWQIPGGHLLTNGDTSGLALDHVATAPDFFFGDSNVALNFPNNIQTQVLGYPLDPAAYGATLTAGQYLQKDTDQQDWGQSELMSAVNNNIVAILWGGGSTTAVATISTNGNDGGWLAAKVEQYYSN